MAASTPLQISAPVLSQKQRRAAQRKERRKRKRQALAQARECDLNNGESFAPEEEEDINDGDDDEDDAAEEERKRLHEEWMERERLAQEEFRLQWEKQEAARKRKEEEERMIKEEWEAQRRKEQEEKEQKQQEKRDREEAVQKMLDEAENQLENGGTWMNPEAPATLNSENFGTERDVANCPFFLKTGACRFGDRCSRKHVYPTASPTLMVVGMFRTFGMEESRRDDYDMDACLEHSEEDLHESFLEFYHDVLPEFRSIGKVVQFKVSCNYEPHLRGNVYIQFDTEDECREAFIRFNGRWYAGRQLHCELCPVTRWKNAICGLFDRQKCPKGKHCNFLHVFRNPGNEFWEADRDLRSSPNRSVRSSRRDGWRSERSWRQRRYSRSPARSERSNSRRDDDRRRSRSRDRRDDNRRTSRSRRSDRRTDASKSRDGSRSRSRDRRRNRSRDKDREHRNRSEDRDEDAPRDAREKSRSGSRERERRRRSRETSPKNPDKGKRKSKDDSDAQRGHKRSKKSKKKSKKKHKKKSHVPEETTSSGESDKEKESEEENHSATSPSGDVNETELTQKNKDESVDNQNSLSPEVKSEQSNSEISVEPSGNGDITSS